MLSTRRTLRTFALAATLLAASAASDRAARAGDAPRAIDAIENDLVADDAAVRAKAAAELVDRFPDGAVAVPMLVDLLDDEDAAVVAAAARAVDSMAVAGAGPLARACSNDALVGPKGKLLARVREADSMKEPRPAGWLLPDPKAPSAGPDSASLVFVALYPWDEREPNRSREGMTQLCTAVRERKTDVQGLAAAALAHLAADRIEVHGIARAESPARSTAARTAIPLTASSLGIRSWTGFRLLRRLAAATPESISALAAGAALADERSPWRASQALATLRTIGPAANGVAADLVRLAGSPNVASATDISRALVRMGHEADVRALLLRKSPAAVDFAAGLAAEKRGADVALPILLGALSDSIYPSLWAISDLGPDAKSALPVLKAQFAKTATIEYAGAILAIAPGDNEASTFVENELVSDAPDHRSQAWRVVARYAPASKSILDATRATILAATNLRVDGLREAISAVARFGPAADAVVEDLVRLAVAEDADRAKSGVREYASDLRERIAEALGRIGPAAAAAVPLLDAWKTKGDETIRVPAAQALRRIRAKK